MRKSTIYSTRLKPGSRKTKMIIWRIIFVLITIILFDGIAMARQVKDSAIYSPRIKQLLSEFEKDAQAEAKFWNDVLKTGTPLVEDDPTDINFRLVTFLWKDDKDTVKSLAVKFWSRALFSNAEYIEKSVLELIPRSHTLFKTFRFPRDMRTSYQFLINDGTSPVIGFDPDEWRTRISRMVPDPWNRKRYNAFDGPSSLLELDGAIYSPYTEERSFVRKGKITEIEITSKILSNQRKVWIYTPADYSYQKTYPLYLFLDAHESGLSGNIPVPVILDNLISEKKIRPGIAVLVGNVEVARVKELFYNDDFVTFITEELLPHLRKKYQFQKNPRYNIIAGQSLSGNMSAYIGIKHPEIFGNVISQSAGFMYGKTFNQGPGNAFIDFTLPQHEWLAHHLASEKKLALRFWISVGILEDISWVTRRSPFAYPSLLVAARHVRDVLQAKGYRFKYTEFSGGHELVSWKHFLPTALMELLGSDD